VHSHRIALLAAGLLCVAACSHSQPSQSVRATSTPQPALSLKPAAPARPRSGPIATASPAAAQTVAPASSGSAAPAPTGEALTTIPRLPANAAPRILSIAVDKTTVASGDRVWGTVLTSSNVASVEVRIGGYGVALNKVGVGRFTLDYRLGNLPFFVHGTFDMSVIARNARGDVVQQTLPITVR
jgi:hypothetical protein